MQTKRHERQHSQQHNAGVLLWAFEARLAARSYAGMTVLLLAVAVIGATLVAREAHAQTQNVPIHFGKAGEITVEVESRNSSARVTHEFGMKSPTHAIACKPCKEGDEASVGKVPRGAATFYLTTTSPAGKTSTFLSNDSEHARVTAVGVGVTFGRYRIEWADVPDGNFSDLVVLVTLKPDPPPGPPQRYTLGTFNMAGGNPDPRYGDRPETADELSLSIKDRGADIVFLQEACEKMTDRMKTELGDEWTVTFQPIPKRRDKNLPADREVKDHQCKTGTTREDGSTFGIGIVVRSSRLTVREIPSCGSSEATIYFLPPRCVYALPMHRDNPARMVCLDIVAPRPLFACSTHLTANPGEKTTNGIKRAEDSRRAQAEYIAEQLSPRYTAGKAVLLGGDFNTTPVPEKEELKELSELNALWHPTYQSGAAGSFIEVDSGPSEETITHHRIGGEGTWGDGKFKYDYIFVRDVEVVGAEVEHAEFSDHKQLWADVVQRTAAARQSTAMGALSAGNDHSCALRAGGTIGCWQNWEQNGTTGFPAPVSVAGISDATQISAGGDHSCALRTGGTISCWGRNSYGQLGNATTTDSTAPVGVAGISDATQISAGYGHSCALRTGGTISCWGSNFSGQLGNATTTDSTAPVGVAGISDATQISAGGDHSCALRTGGTISCWGSNYSGQLGGETSAAISDATEITAGYGGSCALGAGGTITCWGWMPNPNV